jgi:hypothetical protein
MAPFAETYSLVPPQRRQVHWRGRSGRDYQLVGQTLDRFALEEDELYLIAKGRLVLWVGSSDDLVADSTSRSRFRLALDCADRVFRVETPGDELARITTIWDLEGAEPASALSAA